MFEPSKHLLSSRAGFVPYRSLGPGQEAKPRRAGYADAEFNPISVILGSDSETLAFWRDRRYAAEAIRRYSGARGFLGHIFLDCIELQKAGMADVVGGPLQGDLTRPSCATIGYLPLLRNGSPGPAWGLGGYTTPLTGLLPTGSGMLPGRLVTGVLAQFAACKLLRAQPDLIGRAARPAVSGVSR